MYSLIGIFAALLTTGLASPVLPAVPNVRTALGFDPNVVHAVLDTVPAVTGVRLTSDTLPRNLTRAPLSYGSIPLNATEDIAKRLNQPDRRYQYTDPNHFPWRTIGRVNWGGSSTYCTGSLVGPRHVLTAKHCIPPNGGAFQFCPSYDNGPNPTFGCANAGEYYFYNTDGSEWCQYKEDWVVVIIDKRFGDGLGYFGADVPNSGEFDKYEWESVGYAGDLGSGRPWRQDNGRLPTGNGNGNWDQFPCDNTGPIWSDHNSAPGQSGAPIWFNGGTVWGVLHGGNNSPGGLYETLWASGNDMISMINFVRNKFP